MTAFVGERSNPSPKTLIVSRVMQLLKVEDPDHVEKMFRALYKMNEQELHLLSVFLQT